MFDRFDLVKNAQDTRAVRSRQRILDATVALMIERGVDHVNVAAVAAAAGVQRSTVYNHWTDRTDLILDALEHLAARNDQRDTAPADPDGLPAVRALVAAVGRNLAGDWGTVAASLASASEKDERLAHAHQRFVQSRRDELGALIRREIRAGTLRPDLDPGWAVNVLIGPLYYERLVMHRRLSTRDVTNHIDATLAMFSGSKANG